MSQQPDRRSSLSIGMDWATRVSTIGLEFALPAFLGFGLDRWWSTAPWMTILGSFLGLGMGMVHLIQLASELSGSSKQRRETPPGSSGDGKPAA